MNYNSNDLRTDISTVVASVKANSRPIKGYPQTKLSKFFGNEVFKNTTLWKTFIDPSLSIKTKDDLTKISKEIFRNTDFINRMHIDVAYNFNSKFSDEELRCIVQAIIQYIESDHRKYDGIRRYLHLYIKWHGNKIYLLDELKSFKCRIGRTSVAEFEIFMDLIIELLEENDPKYIFKLIKTIVVNFSNSRFSRYGMCDQN